MIIVCDGHVCNACSKSCSAEKGRFRLSKLHRSLIPQWARRSTVERKHEQGREQKNGHYRPCNYDDSHAIATKQPRNASSITVFPATPIAMHQSSKPRNPYILTDNHHTSLEFVNPQANPEQNEISSLLTSPALLSGISCLAG
jgi:hypothetical protein